MRTVVDISGHALRLDERSLRFLIIGAGLCWSVAFVVIALFYELELYGDGAMFSYAVAVRDVWAFHWHNISGRTSVFLLSLLAAEALVGIRGNPWVGIITYGLLFYISPFVGLILTYVADRSPGNTIFVYACTSTAMLCPLIFGFPTVARPRDILARAGTQPLREANRRRFHVGICCTITTGLSTKALCCCCWLLWRHWPHVACEALHSTAATCLIIILIMATISKIAFPPDDYYASAFWRAALYFFDLEIFKVRVVLLLLVALIAYGAILAPLSIWSPRRACVYALGILFGLLSAYWLYFDHSVHASSRYYLRTVLMILTPPRR